MHWVSIVVVRLMHQRLHIHSDQVVDGFSLVGVEVLLFLEGLGAGDDHEGGRRMAPGAQRLVRDVIQEPVQQQKAIVIRQSLALKQTNKKCHRARRTYSLV